MIKKIFSVTMAAVFSAALSFSAFAFTVSHPYVSLAGGDTGATYTWTAPTGTQITMPVIKKDAVISLTANQYYDAFFYDVTGQVERNTLFGFNYKDYAFSYTSVNTDTKTEFTPLKFTQYDAEYMNPLNNAGNYPYRWHGGDFILEVTQSTGDYRALGYDFEGDHFSQMNAGRTAYFYVTMSDNVPDAPAAGWKSDKNGWWYVKSDGNYIANDWLNENGTWYYFNSTGYMATGWANIKNKWYYFNNSGSMTTGWKETDGKWYYFDASGAMLANTTTPDGYSLDASGAMLQ